MGALFWRYFLAQWVAIAILLVFAVVVATQISLQRMQVLQSLQPGNLVRAAMKVAATEGEEGLKRWIRDIDRQDAALTIYLLRDDNTDILGKTVHPRTRAVYAQARDGRGGSPDDRPPRRNDPGSWWQSHRLTMPDGSHLRLVFIPYDNSRWDVLQLSNMPWMLLAVALLVTSVLCWIMTRHVTQPISLLTLVARKMAKGQYAERAPDPVTARSDALGQLGRDFNAMSDRIQKQMQVREQLLRNMAHELRSPLNRLHLAVELASLQDGKLPVQLARIVRESGRLEKLLKHTMELARLSELSVPTARFDLSEMIAEVVADARFEAASQKDRVRWEPDGAPVWIDADRTSLRGALDNVLRNAMRYSRDDLPVTVALALAVRNGRAIITVTDGGPGVPEEDLSLIFEPFQRGGGHRQKDGAGLGLSIARAAVHAHGGNIFARMLPGGQGFQVQLEIPLERGDASLFDAEAS